MRAGARRAGRKTSLRQRVALTIGAIATLSVIALGAATAVLTSSNLEAATDDELGRTAGIIQDLVDTSDVGRGPAGSDAVGSGDNDFTADAESPLPFVQLLGPDGEIVADGGVTVTDAARALVTGSGPDRLHETLTIDGRSVRVLTVQSSGNDRIGAIQVGRDITDITKGLRRSRITTLFAALLAGLASTAAAWLVSKRLVAPVRAVADAADELRSDQELPDRIDGEGGDDLGRLVTSFNRMLDELHRSRRQQRQLVADASHELRTPLTSLRVKIEFLQSQPDLPVAERSRLIDGAVAELSSLSTLVSELVELAAEGSPSDEAPRLVDLAAVVADEVDRFRTVSGRTIELSTSSGMVETRPQQVVRALSNLLVNADKYSPADEPIEVVQRGNRIEVRDHGVGIPPDERERVFDRFYRGPRHQSIEGTGLGLAIVASIARANGGMTWIDSPPAGMGTLIGFSVGPSSS